MRAGIEITAWSAVLLGVTVVPVGSVSAAELLVAASRLWVRRSPHAG